VCRLINQPTPKLTQVQVRATVEIRFYKSTLLEGQLDHNLDGLCLNGHTGPMVPYKRGGTIAIGRYVRETCLLERVSSGPRIQASPQTVKTFNHERIR